jgi:histidine triad (HIT) family protein
VSGCAFCELLTTGEARWVAREPDVVAFAPLPADEFAPGHTLVVPRRHAVGLHDADERDVVAVAVLVRRVSRAMVSALGATGVVVLNASGPNSGQTVGHLHVHVVPRWDDDEATLPWLRQRATRTLPAPAQQLLAAELRSGSRG